jgi:hypothetical protein
MANEISALAADDGNLLVPADRRAADNRQVADGSIRVLERQRGVDVHLAVEVLHVRADFRGGRVDNPHQEVHQVRAGVVDLPAARQVGVLTPSVGGGAHPVLQVDGLHEMHLADFAASDALVHIAVHGDVVALVGNKPDLARLLDFAHERARVFHRADHRLLDHHMQPFIQRVHRLLVVQGVRRDDNHAVHLHFVKHLAVVVEEGHALQVREALGGRSTLVGDWVP